MSEAKSGGGVERRNIVPGYRFAHPGCSAPFPIVMIRPLPLPGSSDEGRVGGVVFGNGVPQSSGANQKRIARTMLPVFLILRWAGEGAVPRF
jgi:hypothetical protein